MILVVALGPNSVEVPCLWFWEKTAAIQYFKDAQKVKGGEKTQLDEEKGVLHCDDLYDYDPMDDEDADEETMWEVLPFWDKFFTGYSNSCGGVHTLEIRNVNQSTPFVGWDLD